MLKFFQWVFAIGYVVLFLYTIYAVIFTSDKFTSGALFLLITIIVLLLALYARIDQHSLHLHKNDEVLLAYLQAILDDEIADSERKTEINSIVNHLFGPN